MSDPSSSSLPDPSMLFLQSSTTEVPTCVLSSVVHGEQQHRKVTFTRRVAASDLRIGLALLGEHGRMLLREYIKSKSQ
jgi:hypothetical protein